MSETNLISAGIAAAIAATYAGHAVKQRLLSQVMKYVQACHRRKEYATCSGVVRSFQTSFEPQRDRMTRSRVSRFSFSPLHQPLVRLGVIDVQQNSWVVDFDE
jgi:hypothetical protein